MDESPESAPPPEGGDDPFVRHSHALNRRARAAERRGLEHLERGLFFSAIESLREAVDTYERLGVSTRCASARQYLALAMYELGEVEEAVEIWEGLVEGGWDRPTTLNFLVRHYEAEGDESKVDSLYAELARSKENGSGIFVDYGELDAAEPEAPNSPGPVILIADNDPAVRNVLGRILEHQGYRVLCAEDGNEALSMALSERPDLIFLDIYMPNHSGLDVLYRIRAEKVSTPVVVISGRPHATMVRDAKVLGAEFASKPLNFEKLTEMVEELLDRTDAG